MICSVCSKDRVQLIQLVCLNCLAQKSKDREMEERIKTMEEKERAVARNRIASMRKGQRSEEDILADIFALVGDFSAAGQKREKELFAERRKVRLLNTLESKHLRYDL